MTTPVAPRPPSQWAWRAVADHAVKLWVNASVCADAGAKGDAVFFATLIAEQDKHDESDGAGGTDHSWWRLVGSTALMRSGPNSFFFVVSNPYLGHVQLARLAIAHRWRVSWIAAHGDRAGVSAGGSTFTRGTGHHAGNDASTLVADVDTSVHIVEHQEDLEALARLLDLAQHLIVGELHR